MVRRWCPFWEPLCSALAATADAAGLVFNLHRLHVHGPNPQQIREPARPMPLKPAIPGRPARGDAARSPASGSSDGAPSWPQETVHIMRALPPSRSASLTHPVSPLLARFATLQVAKTPPAR